jgi:zeaxanthin glucosyltransferase
MSVAATPRKILFVLLPDRGHLTPAFTLGRQLAARGHTVEFATLRSAAAVVEKAGFVFRPAWEALADAERDFDRDNKGLIHGLRGLLLFRRLRDDAIRSLVDELAPLGADLVLLDAVMRPGQVLLERAGMRTVVLSTGLPFFQPPSLPPLGSTIVVGSALAGARTRLAQAMFWLSYRFLRERSMPCSRQLAREASRDGIDVMVDGRELVMCPRAFDWPATDERPEPRGRRYAGSCVDLDRHEDMSFPWERLDGDGPILYAAFGTMVERLHANVARVLRALVDAMRAHPTWRLVLSTQTAAAALAPPPNVIVVPSAPQLAVLRRASVMVTHAGLNSVKECIVTGVPMVAVPFLFDQPGNAARVVFHGMGLIDDPRACTATSLGERLERVLGEPSFAAAVARMRDAFAAADAEALGPRAVEEALAAPLGTD